jgi:hypothetical protein
MPTLPMTFRLAVLGWYFKKKYLLNKGNFGGTARKALHRCMKTTVWRIELGLR